MPVLSSRVAVSGIALTLLLLLSSVPVQAQSNGNGSFYSRFGLGTLTEFSSSQSEALGGGGYALRSLNYNPTANPALWSDQIFTRLSAGGAYESVTASTSDGASGRLVSGTLEGIQVSFPLYDRTLGVGLSFQPYTQHNYRVRQQARLPVSTSPDTTVDVPYHVDFQGNGGLHVVRGGVGARITDFFRLGASLDFVFGLIERQRRTEFNQSALRNVTLTDATRLTGVSGTLGGHLALSNVFREDDAFSIGGSLALSNTLSGTRVLTLGENRDVRPDTLETSTGASSLEGGVTLPWRSRLGLAYQPNGRWTFTADGLYEPWSQFSSTFDSPRPFPHQFPVGGTETLTNRWRLSAGMEVVPAGEEQLSGFFARTAYRLGALTEHLYVRPRENGSVRMHALTGGLSLPTSLSGTRIDLTLRVGTRGTSSSDGVRDNVYGIALHVNFGERWFQQRKLR